MGMDLPEFGRRWRALQADLALARRAYLSATGEAARVYKAAVVAAARKADLPGLTVVPVVEVAHHVQWTREA
jgi:hypothetical protein